MIDIHYIHIQKHGIFELPTQLISHYNTNASVLLASSISDLDTPKATIRDDFLHNDIQRDGYYHDIWSILEE